MKLLKLLFLHLKIQVEKGFQILPATMYEAIVLWNSITNLIADCCESTPQSEIDDGTCDGVNFNRQSVCCKTEYTQCPGLNGCFDNTGTVQWLEEVQTRFYLKDLMAENWEKSPPKLFGQFSV